MQREGKRKKRKREQDRKREKPFLILFISFAFLSSLVSLAVSDSVVEVDVPERAIPLYLNIQKQCFSGKGNEEG